MRDYLSLIAEGRPGTRCDVTPLLADPDAFGSLLDDFQHGIAGFEFDLIAGIDALGFVLGGALAARAHKGFIAIRKGGKLPVPADRVEFTDYSHEAKVLELRHGAFPPQSRILLVDEWIETGAQARAAIELIQGQRGRVVAIVCINCDSGLATESLRREYPIVQVMEPE